MKKYLPVILGVLLLAIVLAGCGTCNNTQANANNQQAERKVEGAN